MTFRRASVAAAVVVMLPIVWTARAQSSATSAQAITDCFEDRNSGARVLANAALDLHPSLATHAPNTTAVRFSSGAFATLVAANADEDGVTSSAGFCV